MWAWRGWRGAAPGRRGDSVADLLWEHAGGALVAVDRLGRISRSNDMARDLLGGPVERHGSALELFAAEFRDGLRAEIVAALPGEPPRTPLRVSLAGGAIVAVTVLRVPARRGSARAGVLLRLTDLRQERAFEEQACKLQALERLSGGIAHDFNNILAAILGAAEAIAGHDGLPAEVAEDAAQIRASAGRGSQLARRLLASGRADAEGPCRVAVPAVITGLASMLRRLLGRAIRLELVSDGDVARQVVVADPVQLDRVLVNLAVNARDAMPAGGELRIESRLVSLHHPHAIGGEAVPPGRWVTIDVRDGGAGIAPETLPRVLEPFFTTRRERGGTGLGLSTVHGIVREAGGFLAIESTLGVGTCVRVWLPACDESPEPPRPAAASVPPPIVGGGGRTVLLVDDEEPVRRLAERALTRQGWRVLAADSAEAALATLDAQPVGSTSLAAMVSDMVMRGLDGAALVDRVRARPGQAALPALLVSGYSDTSLRSVLADQPATGFLAKPYTLGELVSRVAALAGLPGTP